MYSLQKVQLHCNKIFSLHHQLVFVNSKKHNLYFLQHHNQNRKYYHNNRRKNEIRMTLSPIISMIQIQNQTNWFLMINNYKIQNWRAFQFHFRNQLQVSNSYAKNLFREFIEQFNPMFSTNKIESPLKESNYFASKIRPNLIRFQQLQLRQRFLTYHNYSIPAFLRGLSREKDFIGVIASFAGAIRKAPFGRSIMHTVHSRTRGSESHAPVNKRPKSSLPKSGRNMHIDAFLVDLPGNIVRSKRWRGAVRIYRPGKLFIPSDLAFSQFPDKFQCWFL